MQLFSLSRVPLKILGCSAFAALLLGAAPSHAQVNTSYITNFDSLDRTNPLSGQDNWSDNDPNQPDGVVFAPGYSNGTTDLLAFVGGAGTDNNGANVLPSTSPVYLSHPFTPVGTVFSFSTDFAITSSVVITAGVPASQDAFAFTFKNSAGNNVFSVDFAPQVGNANVDAVRFTSYDLAGTTNGQTTTGVGVTLDSRYHLGVSANVLTGAVTLTEQPEVALGGALSGTSLTQTFTVPVGTSLVGVASFAATDILSNPAAPGTNALLFDNLSAVPEPSTYAMLGLGLLGLAARFRRNARA